MIEIDIPGWRVLRLEHLVLDVNGTVTLDGEPIQGVAGRLSKLSAHLAVYLVTADTQGRAEETAARLSAQLYRIEPGQEAAQKLALVERLGAMHTAAIGNGANDAQMLTASALGIAILGQEGVAVQALHAADVVVGRIEDGLDLLLRPRRLVATLRW